jgi:hypothetical protein
MWISCHFCLPCQALYTLLEQRQQEAAAQVQDGNEDSGSSGEYEVYDRFGKPMTGQRGSSEKLASAPTAGGSNTVSHYA